MDYQKIYRHVGEALQLQESGVDEDTFLKLATTFHVLDDHPRNDVVWRKVASLFGRALLDTGHIKTGSFLTSMSQAPRWFPEFTEILTETLKPLADAPAWIKSATGKPNPIGLAGKSLHSVALALAALGAVGGGVMHYAGKRVDEDDVQIEKNRAIYNEYLKLVNELDRKAENEILKRTAGSPL